MSDRLNPRALRVRAPAKINWALAVLRRRGDGYHEIDTVLQTVSLFDDLRLRRIPRAVCRIRVEGASLPVGRENLVHKAWRAMRRAAGDRVRGLEARLVKRIPSGAGLGGGSSDAAAAIVGLNRLYDLRMGRESLASIAASVGSDVAFFVYGGAARARGRGESIAPIGSRSEPVRLVLVFPGFSSSTAEAYAALRRRDRGPSRAPERAERALARGDVDSLRRAGFNAFDRTVTASDPRYDRLRAAMTAEGLRGVMLAGSGSACFGWAESASHARRARARLAAHYPCVWSVRTLKSGVRVI